MSKNPQPLLLAYYGDDFTGSTDVMESLARAGVKTVLFLKPPTRTQLAKFPGLRAFGIAGGSRAMSPARMQRELPPAFKALQASRAPIVHYKTCSTFDSSPAIGSIGKAIELGRRVFGEHATPLVIGAPVLGRYVVFGNLFARSGLDTEPSRLDRHPTMSQHPVTPMDEADIRLHLARQTKLPVELVDVLKLAARRQSLKANSSPQLFSATRNTSPIVLFDTLTETDLAVIGQWIVSQRVRGRQLFCAGSSGIEYSLVAFWRQAGLLPRQAGISTSVCAANGPFPPQIITVSGSCSPVTDRQIGRAVDEGFVEIACDSALLANNKSSCAGVADAISRAQKSLDAGRNIIFQTARGPADSRRGGFERIAKKYQAATQAEKRAAASESLGRGLAQILREALRRTGARRAVVCGGDTSTHIARELGIEALEFLAPVAPGSPLCRVHASGEVADGCRIIFKGGQVGRDSFFPDFANEAPI